MKRMKSKKIDLTLIYFHKLCISYKTVPHNRYVVLFLTGLRPNRKSKSNRSYGFHETTLGIGSVRTKARRKELEKSINLETLALTKNKMKFSNPIIIFVRFS